MGQHCTSQNPMKCCLRGSTQHCIRKNPGQCFLISLGTTLHRSKPYAMLSERVQIILHRKKIVYKIDLLLFGQYWTGQKSLCNVSREALDDIASEKIICNFVLILLKQHCRGRKSVQCCARRFRQHFIKKSCAKLS